MIQIVLLYTIDDIFRPVQSNLYKTFFNFLQSTGNLDNTSTTIISGENETFDKKQDQSNAETSMAETFIVPSNANTVILKGLGTLWRYGREGLRFLGFMSLIIMPNIAIILACCMIPVIFAAVWLPPLVDPLQVAAAINP